MELSTPPMLEEIPPRARRVWKRNQFYFETHFVLFLAFCVFFYALIGWTILGVRPMSRRDASIMLGIVAAITFATRWYCRRQYLRSTPIRSTSGGFSCPRRSTVTPILRSSASSRRTPNRSSRPSTNRHNGRSKSRCRPGSRRTSLSTYRGCAGILWRCTMSVSSA